MPTAFPADDVAPEDDLLQVVYDGRPLKAQASRLMRGMYAAAAVHIPGRDACLAANCLSAPPCLPAVLIHSGKLPTSCCMCPRVVADSPVVHNNPLLTLCFAVGEL